MKGKTHKKMKRKRESFDLDDDEEKEVPRKETKSLKTTLRDAGHEYSGCGRGDMYESENSVDDDVDVDVDVGRPWLLLDFDESKIHSTINMSEAEADLDAYLERSYLSNEYNDEYNGSEEKVKRSLYGDDAGPVENEVYYARRYMTDEDYRIIQIDIPERLQISDMSTGTPPTDDDSIVKEAKWIKEQFKSGQVPGLVRKIVLGDDMEEHIKNFLKFSHVERLDLPYIAMYRKEHISDLLKDPETTGEDVALKRHKVLWAVHDLDRKWLLLQKRKKALHCRMVGDTRLLFNQQVCESFISALSLAESEREVDDVESKFNLHFPSDEVVVDETYRKWKEVGLWKVASKFGYSFDQLVDKMEDPKETPEDVTSNFTCELFNSVEAVLKAARYMASVDLSHEPRVKNHFRSKYFDNAVVSTHPIYNGNADKDAFYQLRDEPLNKIEDEQWLLIQEAAEKGLLRVRIELPKEKLLELISESEKLYLSVSVGKLAQLWNMQRKYILKDAITNFILPALEREARLLLTNRAKNWLLIDYGKCLWDKVSVAPFQPKKRESNSDDGARVMACCRGSGERPTTFVILDSYGELIDVLEAKSVESRIKNATDRQNLTQFILEHQPQVVVVGVMNLSCIWLIDDITEIVIDLFSEKSLGDELVNVVPGDESLPRLYANSCLSSYEFPMEEDHVKQAIALGRYLQNPLAMVANICAPSRKVLSWKLSSLERFLNADEKYAMVERIMVDITNQVGIDLNLAANHDWLFAPMQFISGLGPRKAAALERSLRSLSKGDRKIVEKNELLTHGLKTKVYHSAAGFLQPIQGFQDWRKPYEEPTPKEQAIMIYGPNVIMDVGKTVKATVLSVNPYKATCELESGLTGLLWKVDCPDIADLTSKLHEGDTFTCKIISYQEAWFLVLLTCTENDLRNIGHQAQTSEPIVEEKKVDHSSFPWLSDISLSLARRRKLGLPPEDPAAAKSSEPIVEEQKTILPVKPVTKAVQMRECLQSLKKNHKDEDARVKKAFQTLFTYADNVVKNPDEEKFRKIRVTNQAFQDRVGGLKGGIEFLELCGFEKSEDGEYLFMPREKVDTAVLNSAGKELQSAIENPYFGFL